MKLYMVNYQNKNLLAIASKREKFIVPGILENCPENFKNLDSFLNFEKGQKLSSTELKSYIRKKISPQKTPAIWVEIDEWPLTGSGKIKKFALREQLSDGLLNALN